MYKTLLMAGTLAGLMVAAGIASASPCGTEIEALQKKLSSADARMGTTGTGTVQETGNPPTAAMNSPTNSGATLAGKPDSVFDPQAVEESLKRARQFDQAGDEEDCVNEVRTARMRLGIQ